MRARVQDNNYKMMILRPISDPKLGTIRRLYEVVVGGGGGGFQQERPLASAAHLPQKRGAPSSELRGRSVGSVGRIGRFGHLESAGGRPTFDTLPKVDKQKRFRILLLQTINIFIR